MAVLQQRSDGFCETQDGDFAVFMLRGIKNDNGVHEFTYSPDFTSPRIKVTWQGDVGYFSQDLARALIAKGFARQLTLDELKVVNGENVETANIDDNAREAQKVQKNSTPKSKTET